MPAFSDTTAIVVTRGDVELGEILDSLKGFAEVLVWSNSGRLSWLKGRVVQHSVQVNDCGVYGRYAAMHHAALDHPYVYVQDDDCLIDSARLLEVASVYDTSTTIVANMPASRWPDYPDSCLVGWGAVFSRDLPVIALGRFVSGGGPPFAYDEGIMHAIIEDSEPFCRCCDVVFTTLTPHVKVDIGFQHLPWAETEGRMFKQPNHKPERERFLALAREVRDGATIP